MKGVEVGKISYIVNHDSGCMSIVANGQNYIVGADHPNHKGIKAAVMADDVAKLVTLVDIPRAVQVASHGKVEVRNGVVYYQNEPQHTVIATRILQLMNEGYRVDHLLKFLENLMQNPCKRSVDELYKFLEHELIPITDDGCFLGYKSINEDWTDKFSGKVDNHIGKKPSMRRNTVDDNWRLACSSGFHVGSLKYVESFHGGCGRIVIVKVNPADVVSVPSEDCHKMRVSTYEVVDEFKGKLDKAVYASEVNNVHPVDPDEDWDCDREFIEPEEVDEEIDDTEETAEETTGWVCPFCGDPDCNSDEDEE